MCGWSETLSLLHSMIFERRIIVTSSRLTSVRRTHLFVNGFSNHYLIVCPCSCRLLCTGQCCYCTHSTGKPHPGEGRAGVVSTGTASSSQAAHLHPDHTTAPDRILWVRWLYCASLWVSFVQCDPLVQVCM